MIYVVDVLHICMYLSSSSLAFCAAVALLSSWPLSNRLHL